MITEIEGLPSNVVAFVASGEVTASDYEDRLVPAIDAALEEHEKVRLLYVLGPEFHGYSGGAMWADGKLGLHHLTKWERIAVVTDSAPMRHALNVLGYLIPGEVKVFELDGRDAATAWVTE